MADIIEKGFGPGKMQSNLRVLHEKEGVRLSRQCSSRRHGRKRSSPPCPRSSMATTLARTRARSMIDDAPNRIDRNKLYSNFNYI